MFKFFILFFYGVSWGADGRYGGMGSVAVGLDLVYLWGIWGGFLGTVVFWECGLEIYIIYSYGYLKRRKPKLSYINFQPTS